VASLRQPPAAYNGEVRPGILANAIRNPVTVTNMTRRLTAVIHREGDGFVALCPELDVASQGDTIEEARNHLREALELFFECASPAETQARLGEELYVTQVEVACG
jgi:predicted RNase H-like HicB family nuclease